MKTINDKIGPRHLDRNAVIYIRQSSERQVRYHTESSRVQYGFSDQAKALGWEKPIIIDEDLGKSADYTSERPGFQRLVTLVSMGDVGLILSVEVTRLARNNRDWYHLIDLCTLFDTLIGDYQSIYDPKDPNDRLLLGVKGSMSEAELNLIKARMRHGRLSKAKRGALYSILPPGYILCEDEAVVKVPDLREQQAVELVLAKFRELSSAKQTYLWFNEENIMVPVNCTGNDIEGRKRRWQLPTYSFILQMLHNPFYAGAYVYGRRSTQIKYCDGLIKKTAGHYQHPDEWEVFIKDHHEGYISWEEYEENQRILGNNQYTTNNGDEAVGAVRNGQALLVGLLRCQRCGRKMHVRYWGKNGINPRYVCSGDYAQGGYYCQSFSAVRTDRVFEAELFRAIEPAALQASMEAIEFLSREYEQKIQYLEKEVEHAQYEADKAFMQYNQVDPLNRLVASELERRWNDKLKILEGVKERIIQEKQNVYKPTAKEITQIKSLSDRLPEVWNHPQTEPAQKKRIVRMMVEEVLIRLDDERPLLIMTIHWQGGVHTQIQFKKPFKGEQRYKTADNIVEMLGQLAPHFPDEIIAQLLNCHNYKTGKGNRFTRTRVRGLRVTHNIAPFDRKQKRDAVSLNEAARRLGVTPSVVRGLIKRGIIKAKQIIKYAPFEIMESEFEKDIVHKTVSQLRGGQTLKSIEGVDANQMRLF